MSIYPPPPQGQRPPFDHMPDCRGGSSHIVPAGTLDGREQKGYPPAVAISASQRNSPPLPTEHTRIIRVGVPCAVYIREGGSSALVMR